MMKFLEKLLDCDGVFSIWLRFWHVLLWVYGIVILVTFQEYGVTSDEHHHVKSGKAIWGWYRHFFGDYSVFETSNMWLYGGFVDLTAYVLAAIWPLGIYDTLHLYSALIGLLGVIAAYRLGCLFGGPRAGFIVALFLVLTPRYYGHAFNNPKDIPFAVFYLWSMYYLIIGLSKMPHVSFRDYIKLGVAIGLTMAIRSSGVVLFFYSGLGLGLWYMLHRSDVDGFGIWEWVKRVGVVVGVSYAVLMPFWPWLQIHPLTGLWDGVKLFASFAEVHHSFFEGAYVSSDTVPRYYAPKWLLLTLPEFVLVGLMCGLAWFLVLMKGKSDQILQWGLLCFAGAFPLVYAVVGGTPLYDGLRQMLFVVPPLVVVAGVGFERCISLLESFLFRVVGWIFAACLLLLVLWDMVVMHPNQYVYFNRAIGGGLAVASTDYETDYWNHTYKQGVRWVEENYERFTPVRQMPRIASLYPHLKEMIDFEAFDLVAPEEADFYLGNTRFDHHRAVPGEILHTVEVHGVSLLYVIRPDSIYRDDPFFYDSAKMHDQLGDVYRDRGHLDKALQEYEVVLKCLEDRPSSAGLDRSGILAKIGNLQLRLGQEGAAMGTFDRISDKAHYAGAIGNNVGFYLINQNRLDEAIKWLQDAVSAAPDFYNPYMNLAKAYVDQKDTTQAVNVYKAAAEHFAVHSSRQFELGNLLYELGAYDESGTCFERMTRFHNYDVRGPYYLGLALLAKGDQSGARKAFEAAIKVDPQYLRAYQSLGNLHLELEDVESAKKAFEGAIQIAPNEGHLYAKLGLALIKLKEMDAAVRAFDRALALDPEEPTAREYHRFLRSMLGK